MPEALATSKRKFYKFLDNFSDGVPSSTTSDHSQSLNNPPKRHSFLLNYRSSTADQSTASQSANPDERPTKRVRTSTPAIKDIDLPRRNSSSSLPPFCPWSHDAFLSRLQTFSPVTSWLPKPNTAVGEVEWAKRGWECVGVETVGCKACKNRLVVDFSPSKLSSRFRYQEDENNHLGDEDGPNKDEEADQEEDVEGFEKGLVDRYKTLIIGGHTEDCLWRKAGCKDDIYRLGIVRSLWWQEFVKKSFKSTMSMEKEVMGLKLCDVKMKGGEDVKLDSKKILADLPAAFFESPDENADQISSIDLKERALIIALTGWTASTEFSNNLLSCGACFQRIGLWMYQSQTAEENGANDSEALDLLQMHREHCPFVNAESQCATGDYQDWPGWRILWNVVARYADEQRRRSRNMTTINVEPSNVDNYDHEQNDGSVLEDTSSETTQLTREELIIKDKQRTNKLRNLKRVLGFKFRMPRT